MTAVPAFPLAWPAAWKRIPAADRKDATFARYKNRLSVAQGVERVRDELRRMRVSDNDLVVSTNVALRLDGFPRSDQREPEDPGAAVYWRDSGETRCMAIDRYTKVADNLAAIAATLEAMRAIERHGGAEILNRAFTGFTALGHDSGRRWWDVLGVASDASSESIRLAYMRRRSATHPDRGGDATEYTAVEKAYGDAMAEGRTHG